MTAPAAPAPPSTRPTTSGASGTEVTTAGPTVLGDGTTAGGRLRSRWRRARWAALVIAALLLTTLGAAVLRPPTTGPTLGPDNPRPDGARALAQVLGRQGVDVQLVRSTADAVRRAGEGTTLLVTGTWLLEDEQVRRLVETDADLVVLEPEAWHVDLLTDGAAEAGRRAAGPELRSPDCDDPAAVAAEAVRPAGPGFRLNDGSSGVLCFTSPDNPTVGAYLVLAGDRRVVLVDDGSMLMNSRLAEDGHAALALHTLGRHDRLVWYVPSPLEDPEASAGTADLLPPGAGAVAAQLALVALVAALWRGRRLGRVVTEPLPVTVRAAETTLGRGRLYRRARARGHAAAALRAGAARRSARRLGLPRSAGATAVIDAIARATGRPDQQVAGLLYGPPPTDDTGLVDLARQLDELESEVHRT